VCIGYSLEVHKEAPIGLKSFLDILLLINKKVVPVVPIARCKRDSRWSKKDLGLAINLHSVMAIAAHDGRNRISSTILFVNFDKALQKIFFHSF